MTKVDWKKQWEIDTARKRVCAMARQTAKEALENDVDLNVAMSIFREKMFHWGEDRAIITFAMTRVKQSKDFFDSCILRDGKDMKMRMLTLPYVAEELRISRSCGDFIMSKTGKSLPSAKID